MSSSAFCVDHVHQNKHIPKFGIIEIFEKWLHYSHFGSSLGSVILSQDHNPSSCETRASVILSNYISSYGILTKLFYIYRHRERWREGNNTKAD